MQSFCSYTAIPRKICEPVPHRGTQISGQNHVLKPTIFVPQMTHSRNATELQATGAVRFSPGAPLVGG